MDYSELIDNPIEQERFKTLQATLAELQVYFRDKRVLDFGASFGLSMSVLLDLGAREVIGVEPDLERVETGQPILERMGYGERAQLVHVEDTRTIPLESGEFDVVLANAVFEHIPQPRQAYIAEVWRLVAEGGYLIINETPNKYFPIDVHTTGLLFVPWMPSRVARSYAVARKRFSEEADWASSGWRGLGYYEVTSELNRFRYWPERSTPRHRLFTSLGLPASLIDPYPTWIFEKLKFQGKLTKMRNEESAAEG